MADDKGGVADAGADKGKDDAAAMRALQERFQWKGGIALKDWRYVVRICNLDSSDARMRLRRQDREIEAVHTPTAADDEEERDG